MDSRDGREHDGADIKPIPAMREVLWRSVSRRWNERPGSVSMLLAVLVFAVLAAGSPMLRGTPRGLALFLALNLVFFYAVMVFAIADLFSLGKRFFLEQEALYRDILAGQAFVAQLRRQVGESRED